MKKLLKLILLSFVLSLVAGVLCSAQSIPAIQGKTLDNSDITLPSPGSQQILILILGFSRNSGKLCEGWSKKIADDYRGDNRVGYFSLPALESAPSLFRPMIVRGMRKGVPVEERRRFVPIYSHESDWKKLVSFSAPDDAYLIVATPDGHPVWQAHGPYSDAMYGDLKKSVAALLEKAAR